MQVGNAEYVPHRLFPPNSRTAQLHNGLSVEYFDYAPSLAPYMESAALVISHAGKALACSMQALLAPPYSTLHTHTAHPPRLIPVHAVRWVPRRLRQHL